MVHEQFFSVVIDLKFLNPILSYLTECVKTVSGLIVMWAWQKNLYLKCKKKAEINEQETNEDNEGNICGSNQW